MSETKHTPGPWTAKKMHTGAYDIFDPRDRDVVTVYGGGVEFESCAANARLIASAPDLLEALHGILNLCPATCETSDAHAMADIAREAIAKATGQ